MSRILIPSTPLAGHVNPMVLVAAVLVQKGHEVFFTTSDNFRGKVKSSGARFLPLLGNANYDYRQLSEIIPELAAAKDNIDQLSCYVKHLFGDRIPDQYRGIREIIQSESIDVVLSEIGFLGMLPLLLSEQPRPPVLSCGVIAPVYHDPAFSIFSGPDTSPEGMVRNRIDNELYDAQRAPGFQYVDAVLRGLGVEIPGGYSSNALYRLPDVFLQFGSEEFEYPLHDQPDSLRFIGPILPRLTQQPFRFSWLDTLDSSKPVVFVTQGTLANLDLDQVIRPTIAALANDDVQLVVTTGGNHRCSIIAPENTIIESYIPYEQILPKADVFVTNGGYNGVQQALSYVIPVVAIGLSEDKGAVCDRVNWSATGIGIKARAATTAEVRDAVRNVLSTSKYRERARTLGSSIARLDALTSIADLVEVTDQTAVESHVSA